MEQSAGYALVMQRMLHDSGLDQEPELLIALDRVWQEGQNFLAQNSNRRVIKSHGKHRR